MAKEIIVTQELKDKYKNDRFLEAQPLGTVLHQEEYYADGKKYWYFLEEVDKVLKNLRLI